MKTFAITIATIAGLLAHQAVAADTMIEIQFDDHAQIKIEETASDGHSRISECGMYHKLHLIYLK